MAVALRLRGRLDVDALGAALADVVGRHESLRTLFRGRGDTPAAVVPVDGPTSAGSIIDAAPAGRRAGWGGHRHRGGYRFDLADRDPVAGTTFPRHRPGTCAGGAVHHIAGDGWSVTPLVRDLSMAYAQPVCGQAPGWAALAVQYVDYTLWQRAQLGDLADSH